MVCIIPMVSKQWNQTSWILSDFPHDFGSGPAAEQAELIIPLITPNYITLIIPNYSFENWND